MRNKLFFVIAIFCALLISLPSNLMANDEKAGVYVLEEITVKGELTRPTKQTGDSLYTGSSVTRKGIELLFNLVHSIHHIPEEKLGEAYK